MTARIQIDQDRLTEFCRRWKIAELSPFGSVLRDDFRPDSDVDLLVTFASGAGWSLFDQVAMEEQLATMIGRKVDLVSRQAVERSKNYIRRKHILNSLPASPITSPAWRDQAYLLDALLAVRRAQELSADVDRDRFERDRLVQAALLKVLTDLGRAAWAVSRQTKDAHSAVPWAELAELARHLIEEYDRVSLSWAWRILQQDVPRLVALLEPLVPAEEDV